MAPGAAADAIGEALQQPDLRRKVHDLFGIEFTNILPTDAEALTAYAKKESSRPKTLKALIVGLVLALILFAVVNLWTRSESA